MNVDQNSQHCLDFYFILLIPVFLEHFLLPSIFHPVFLHSTFFNGFILHFFIPARHVNPIYLPLGFLIVPSFEPSMFLPHLLDLQQLLQLYQNGFALKPAHLPPQYSKSTLSWSILPLGLPSRQELFYCRRDG